MILVPNHDKRLVCVFSGLCNHGPATHIYHHEFANYGPKPLCEEHARIVRLLAENKPKRKAKRP